MNILKKLATIMMMVGLVGGIWDASIWKSESAANQGVSMTTERIKTTDEAVAIKA